MLSTDLSRARGLSRQRCGARVAAIASSSVPPPPPKQQQQQQQQQAQQHSPQPLPAGLRPPPRLPGQLPWLGALGTGGGLRGLADGGGLFTLYRRVEDAFKAQAARVLEVEVMGQRMVYLRHPEDVARVCRDPQRFPKPDRTLGRLRAWLGDGLVTNRSTANQAAIKELLMPAFKAASVRAFVPEFARAANAAADVLLAASGAPVDVEPLCRRATLDVIGRTGFGYDFGSLSFAAAEVGAVAAPVPNRPDLIGLYDGLLRASMWLVFDPPLPDWALPGHGDYVAGIRAIDGVIDAMVAERRANGVPDDASDLLAYMLRAQQGGPSAALMTDKQLRDELHTLIVAGSDTTATTLAFALAELARRPDVAEAAAAEVATALGGAADPGSLPADAFGGARMPLVAAIASETLRLYPAATETGRACARDEAFGEHLLPAGSNVLPSLWSLQRHEDFWPRPDEWLPERWLPAKAAELAPHAATAFMPFTVGPRACIGKYFALLELQVMLAVVLSRVRLAPAPPGAGAGGSDRGPALNLATRANFTLASAGGLPVVAAPR